MSGGVRTLRTQWPNTVEPHAVLDAVRVLAATAGTPLVVEAIAKEHGRVEHRLRLLEGRAATITSQLRAIIGGLGIESVDEAPSIYTHAVELRVSTKHRPLRAAEAEAISRAVLTALARVGRDEVLSLQWWLFDRLPPTPVASSTPISTLSWGESLLRAPFGVPPTIDNEARTALRTKRSEPGWKALGRIAVRATSTARAQQLIGGVVGALRTSEAPGVHLTTKLVRNPNRIPHRGGLRLNVSELASVCAWPMGNTAELPVVRLGSRRLPAPSVIARDGRVIGESTWPGKRRPLALSAEDSTRHCLLIGPTGTGKTTLAKWLIKNDIEAGRSVVVIEPGGDLVRDVLALVPKSRINDVVLLDPTEEAAVGIAPLSGDLAGAELRADLLLNSFHSLYQSSFGPRTSDVLHAALLTLARTPGMSLAALPLLLSDSRFRRRLIGDLDDPLGLGPFWHEFERLSDAEKATATAPVARRLRPFLVRSSLRHIIGQAEPRFDLGSLFRRPRILLVNLARGEIGPEAADLLGALVLSGLWQQAQARASLPPEQRPLVSIVLEEFPSYLHLPVDVGDALARGRALGVGFTLIAQALTQMDERMRSAVMSNARSTVCFQLSPKDAATMASTSPILGSEDFLSLGTFEFYARLMADGAVQPWCSGKSLPPPKAISDPEAVRAAASANYAVSGEVIDAQLRSLFQPITSEVKASDFGPRRRNPGGSS